MWVPYPKIPTSQFSSPTSGLPGPQVEMVEIPGHPEDLEVSHPNLVGSGIAEKDALNNCTRPHPALSAGGGVEGCFTALMAQWPGEWIYPQHLGVVFNPYSAVAWVREGAWKTSMGDWEDGVYGDGQQ
ncbi:hypothetical protein DSO57_1026945 [Entomophthora muscae]|uniref:Uncharacterized protein n=1 Tax=Entomophthora muscae TaxID=34485 RepID=A0ACC2T1Z6_9FUNG|nr:hypothetical protein DSO57_1026945 [Entomophthora muscae]